MSGYTLQNAYTDAEAELGALLEADKSVSKFVDHSTRAFVTDAGDARAARELRDGALRRLGAVRELPGGEVHAAVLGLVFAVSGSVWRHRVSVPREVGIAFAPESQRVAWKRGATVPEAIVETEGNRLLAHALAAYAATRGEGVDPETWLADEAPRVLDLSADNMRKDAWVYFARSGGRIKIGWTSDVALRLYQVGLGCPGGVELLALRPGGRTVEQSTHERFAASRIEGEWFRADADLMAFVAVVRKREGDPARLVDLKVLDRPREVKRYDVETDAASLPDLLGSAHVAAVLRICIRTARRRMRGWMEARAIGRGDVPPVTLVEQPEGVRGRDRLVTPRAEFLAWCGMRPNVT